MTSAGETHEGRPLSEVAARSIRAEAARAGLTQAQLGEALGINRVGIGHRFRGVTPWSLDEVERAARLFGLRPGDLLTEGPRADDSSGGHPATRHGEGHRHLAPVA